MIDFDVIAYIAICFPFLSVWCLQMLVNLVKAVKNGIQGGDWQVPLIEFTGQMALSIATIIIGFCFLTR